MPSASTVFTQVLRAVVRPELDRRGFAFDGSRTFRRLLHGGTVCQLVNFQLGQRSHEGKFAVNLGVYVPGEVRANEPGLLANKAFEYHCATARRVRLGCLIPRALPALANAPVVGALFGPRDVWWGFSADPARTEASVRAALAVLERHGYAWLDAATPGESSTSRDGDA